MFIAILVFFIVFTVLYVLFAAAIIYHLRQYTLPGHPTSKIVISIFLFLATLFWLFSLTFLFKIPY